MGIENKTKTKLTLISGKFSKEFWFGEASPSTNRCWATLSGIIMYRLMLLVEQSLSIRVPMRSNLFLSFYECGTTSSQIHPSYYCVHSFSSHVIDDFLTELVKKKKSDTVKLDRTPNPSA